MFRGGGSLEVVVVVVLAAAAAAVVVVVAGAEPCRVSYLALFRPFLLPPLSFEVRAANAPRPLMLLAVVLFCGFCGSLLLDWEVIFAWRAALI